MQIQTMRILVLYAALFLLLSCSTKPVELKTGSWRGILELQGQQLPFLFDVVKQNDSYQAILHNDTERIVLDEVSIEGDSVSMVLHVFDAALEAKIEGNKLTGTFVKNYAPEVNLPFRATFSDDYKFTTEKNSTIDFSGKYQVQFFTEKDTSVSVGIFEQKGNTVTGTFLTTTGDYRFLDGNVVNDELRLSTFDGNHAFLFTAKKSGDTLRGDYYSGKSHHETWVGVKNENAKMPDAEALTFLKPGYEKLEFSFPDVDGKKVSPSDERFKNKVLILQIFGTWCPNCMDETKFLKDWYVQNKDRGVEILGLAYERKDDFAYASERVKKMKNKWNVTYDFVIAGVNDKEKASQTLPALNRIMSFPTTIFIGGDGKVKHIHTGFSGPGTGIYYEQFKERFNQIVNELLAENLASVK
jgi:thiol-disulfide isomerase/thioredoxin